MTRYSLPDTGPTPPAFQCVHCYQSVPGMAPGTTHRNHCPQCLWSRHVDLQPGDRRSACQGAMEPVAIHIQPNGEWSLVHRCTRCGMVRLNRIAGDDNEWLLMSMAFRPLAQPPFPLARLKSMAAMQEEHS